MKFRKDFLVPFLVCCMLIGCGSEITAPTETGRAAQTDAAQTEAVTEETDVVYQDDLGEKDFGETEFRILTGVHGTAITSTYSREETGDLLDDVLYKRNIGIEDRFNITFREDVQSDIMRVTDIVKKNVSAGDNAYEMAMMVDRFALNAGMEGYLYDYNSLPCINLDKPYWNQNVKKDFTVNGHLFFAYGDDNLMFFGSTTIFAFNQNLLHRYDLENPYQLVYDGKWTYDRYMEMNRAVTADLNGDGQMGIEDQYGTLFLSNMFFPNFWLQDGLKLVEKDSKGLPYFNVPGNEPLISLMEKLGKEAASSQYWYNMDARKDVRLASEYGQNYDLTMGLFSEGRFLFVTATFTTIMDARNMEEDFGILPYPATEEKEPGYIYGSRTFGGFPYVVPVTVENLDMVRKNRITDLAETYWWDNVESPYEQYLKDGKYDIVSETDSIRKKAENDIAKGTEFFLTLD